ncbi:cytochrome ubiquinol oxidase subunit I [Candidatus Finniella inopinata]|uniref:Cytochrome ubiquinol oxidase subunit I n=1 Tax=Candidatus Finniella inopinata TaxID=1696036 RepID=A0A4Q7DG65_9PROT|nr:cytochrome ubiquinol oxidase subunit I [Candidatus Finniella inopinata]RZI45178.1 cytochrome ubiquinol oxidase subunit I [Candidatus Finniella inopinata]
MILDPVILARIQFAFTISFHIIFPAFTIGLASWLTVLEGMWLKTGNTIYKDLYQMWVKIFALAFGMGVVSGVVLSYQLGTNWSGFSDKIGNVLGPLLGFEVLTAFFLEASFLGIMLFGWGRVSRKMHFTATLIVATGTIISAFWILAANSWMHTPAGFEIREGNILYPTNWLAVIFNPSFPYRFCHMITAAYLTSSFSVGGVAAWYLLKKKHLPHAKIMFSMAMMMAVFIPPLQVVLGDLHGLNTLKHQPVKVAAMEGAWETEKGAPLRLFGWPDSVNEKTLYSLEIPKLTSLILTHSWDGEVKGLKAWPKENRPPVGMVFWCFRIMVGIGGLMILTGILAAILFMRKRLFDTRWFQRWCIALTPAGFIAVLAGWFVTEMGRQPYVVYGVIRTSEASSPVLGEHILISLMAFVAVYTFVFGAGVYYICRLVRKGPIASQKDSTYGSHGLEKPGLV